jgi:TPR repeat protein
MYLYNLAHTAGTVKEHETTELPLVNYGINNDHVQMMMEWGYELPLFFHPLFAGDATIDTPVYNGMEGGIYAPATPGIKAFNDLYDFIEKHQHTLVDDIPAFLEAKKKIMTRFSKKIIHNTFHLDACDVFNMSEERHAEQARELLDTITANNAAIAAAIDADNPALLNDCPLFLENRSYYKSFRQLLNIPEYEFGWRVLQSSISEEEEALQPFTEGALTGLKDADGQVVVPAIYDEIFSWPYDADLAVVIREGKAGYIDKSGKEVLPCQFDDAFDFEEDLAAVVANGKFGVIDTTGAFKLPATYDDGHILSPSYIAVQQNERWAIIDPDGKELLPFMDVKEIVAEEGYDFPYYRIVGHDDGETYYTHQFKPLVTGPITGIECFREYYIVRKDEHAALFDAQGNMLLGFDYLQIRPDHPLNGLIVVSSGGNGLYAPDKGWILPCAYDAISVLKDSNPRPDSTVYAVVKKDKKAGLFGLGPQDRWIIPVLCQDFKWLKEGYLGYKENKLWGLVDTQGQLLSKAIYTSINSKLGYLPYGEAMGFSPTGITIIAADGSTRSLLSTEALKETEYYPGAYYSKKEIQQLEKLSESAERAMELHDEGVDCKEAGNYEAAIALFRQSAELGDPAALTNIGHIYEVVDEYRDLDKAFSYYMEAAKLREPYAMSNLGLAFTYGRGTPVDMPAAISWLQKAADQNHPDAFVYLGNIYYSSEFGLEDFEKAFPYYLKAHVHGQDVSHALGHIYETNKEYEQAIYHYRISADNGNAFAQWHLACLYIDGNGVSRDLQMAMQLLLEAVENQAEAHVDLAILYMSAPFYNEDNARMHLEAAEQAGISYVGEYIERYKFLWKGKR